MTPGPVRAGLRVFLVEDEFAVLLLLEDMLTSLGCEIVATASDLASALRLGAACDVDVAVLDINIAGRKVYPVAELLKGRRIPILFSTGYGRAGVEPAWQDRPIVQKPFTEEELADALATIAGS